MPDPNQTPTPTQAAPDDLSGWTPVQGTQQPVPNPSDDLSGWAPVSGTEKPVAPAPAPAHAPDEPGTLHKLWDWANKGLVSKDAIVGAIRKASDFVESTLPETSKTKPGQTVHIPGFGDIDPYVLARGVQESSAGVASDLTSPLSIAMFGQGAIAEGAGEATRAARAITQAQKAGKIVSKVAGVGFGAQAAEQALTPQQPGETEADALERRLKGAGFAALATHAEAETVKDLVSKGIESAKGAPAAIADTFGKVLGRTTDFDTAVKRASKIAPKKLAEHLEKIADTSEDLQAIVNDNPDISSPKEFADAIRQHNQIEEQKMQRAAGATKDSTEPVVPNAEARIRARLEKFFNDNKGKFSAPDVEKAKQDVMDHFLQRDDLGQGDTGSVYANRAPNLYEAENVRQGLNDQTRPQFNTNAQPTTNAFKAAAFDAANAIREMIDESYHDKGVEGVKEFRSKEAKKIDVADALEAAQAKADEMGQGGTTAALMAKYGTPSAVLALVLGGPAAGLGVGAAEVAGVALGNKVYQNLKNPNVNVQRATELAAKNPNAVATKVTEVPTPAAPAIPEPPTDHALHAALATREGSSLAKTNLTDLKNKFLEEVRSRQPGPNGKIPMSEDDVDVLRQINESDAKARAFTEDATRKAADKLAADQQKQAEKQATEQQKAADKAAAAAEKEAADKKEKESLGLKTNMMSPFETESHIHPDDEFALHHELGHHFQIAKAGYPTHDIIGRFHDQLDKGATAEARWNHDEFHGEDGNIDMNKVKDNLGDLLDIFHGGALANEVMSDVPVHKNRGAGTDLFRARKLLMDAGFSPSEAGQLMAASEARVRKDFTTPGVRDIFQRYAQGREAGIDTGLLMTPETSGRAIQEFKDVIEGTNETNDEPTSAGKNKPSGGKDKSGGAGAFPRGRKSGAQSASEEGKSSRGSRGEGKSEEPEREVAPAVEHRDNAIGGDVRLGENGDKGYLAYSTEGQDASVRTAMVDKAERGKGNGQRMYEEAAAKLRDKGVERFHSDPEETSADAARVWDKLSEKHPGEITKGDDGRYTWNLKTNMKEAETKPFGEHDLRNAADEFNKAHGRPPIETAHVPEDARSPEVADAYKNAVHAPNDPAVKASYDALKRDVKDQYHLAQKLGIKMDTKPENPYGLSTEVPAHEELHNDIRNNKHLSVWEGGKPPADHPLSEIDPETGKSYNDLFRMVHDIFGHAAERTDFSPSGEESAWNLHRQMFSPEARPALATETKGQAAYTYKYGDFPPQKAAILPEHLQAPAPKTEPGQWAHDVANNLEKASAGGINPSNPGAPSKRYGFEILPEARQPLTQNPTAQDFHDYAQKHGAEIGSHPDIKLGWDTTGDKPELNVGATTDNLELAKKMAAKLDQRALWDNKEEKIIDVGGKGEKTSFPEYPLKDRLNDLKMNKDEVPEDFAFGKNAEGTEDQQKGLVSTRLPGGRKATENPMSQDLRIGRDSIDNAPELAKKHADLVREYPGVKIPDNVKDPKKVLDKFVDHAKENLKDLYNQVPPERQQANMKWYDSAHDMVSKMADKFGKTTRQLAGVVAAMSPQKDWDQNVSLAERVNDAYHTKQDLVTTPEMLQKGAEIGARPTGKAFAGLYPKLEGKTFAQLTDPLERSAWIRLYDEAHNPRDYQSIDPATGLGRGTVKGMTGEPKKVGWGSLNEIGKALSILDDGSRENINASLGDGHKVRNFYNNILDPNNPAGHVTIDTHAVAAALQRMLSGESTEVGHNFSGPGAKQTGANGTYGLYAEAYRKAAQELGVQPRQLQSVVWEEIRNMFPAEVKSQAKNVQATDKIWSDYKDGKISLDKARQSVRQYAQDAAKELGSKQKPGKMKAQDFISALQGTLKAGE
jgi:predicted GNAT family acetyltransferase